MKMRNWLKTTLAMGLVAATGSVLVGCGCDEEISYAAGMTAYHEVLSSTGAPTADIKEAAKDGFTLSYTFKNQTFTDDGTKDALNTTNIKVESIPGDNGISKVTKKTKAGNADEVTATVIYAKTKVGEDTEASFAFYGADKKEITPPEGTYGAIDFEHAYFNNVLMGMMYLGNGADFGYLTDVIDLDKETAYKDAEDIVKKFNEDNNKTASATNVKKVLTAKFVKNGDTYKLTLGIERTSWVAGETADTWVATVDNQQVTFEIKDKTITKINATSTQKVGDKQKKDKSFEITVEYKKPALTAETSITTGGAAQNDLISEQFGNSKATLVYSA